MSDTLQLSEPVRFGDLAEGAEFVCSASETHPSRVRIKRIHDFHGDDRGTYVWKAWPLLGIAVMAHGWMVWPVLVAARDADKEKGDE